MDKQKFEITPEAAGSRVDGWLAEQLGVSRSAAAALCQKGQVKYQGRLLAKNDKLPLKGKVTVTGSGEKAELTINVAPVPGLEILHVDDNIVIVNKPVGVAAHPAEGWEGPTVIGGVLAAGITIATSGPQERIGIVHRIDVGTSGLMVLARNEETYQHLLTEFQQRTVNKVYHALIEGHLPDTQGTITAKLGRHPVNKWKFAVVADGRDAVTHYEVLKTYPGFQLLQIHLETGRTHQIRVHLAALHHPCVGDSMYGANPKISKKLKLTRQWLHAATLGFTLPDGKEYEFSAPYPQDLATALAQVAAAGEVEPIR